MSTVFVNGVDLEYFEEGSGVPVVFSHGGGSDLRYWEPQRRPFAGRYQFVAYSRRSFGSSEQGQDAAVSPDDHADDLVAIIRQLRAGPVHLVGFSAATALLAALRAPGLLRTLTIIEPNVPSLLEGDREGEPVLAWWRSENARVQAEAAGDAERHAALWFELVQQRGPGTFAQQPPAFRKMWVANMTAPRAPAAGQPTVTCRDLHESSVATLALGTEYGMPYSRLILDRLAACMPDCRLVVVPAVTHFVSYQAPDTFNDTVLAFLAQH